MAMFLNGLAGNAVSPIFCNAHPLPNFLLDVGGNMDGAKSLSYVIVPYVDGWI